jgi:hypothetical protein
LRRPLRGELSPLPLFAVDLEGSAQLLTQVSPLWPQGCHTELDGTPWPVPDDNRDGWWDGLPYPLYDIRPQGYMGRQFARAQHQQLGVSPDPSTWNDDDILFVLSRAASDASGNLILGEAAYERWLAVKMAPPTPIDGAQAGAHYAALAERALAAGVAGSSAAGEFPKFAALRSELPGSATPHVLVKFSGADDSPTVQRWADLLVCEHLALRRVHLMPGATSASSRIVRHAGRTFLELERFDRHGLFGRSPLCALDTLQAALLGDSTSDWTRLGRRLEQLQLIGADDVARIDHLWWYGRLIGNTDMHTGNLSLHPQGTLALAPAYDMLPMLHAPLPGGELPTRVFEPALPQPPQRPAWEAACRAALDFWQAAAQDTRISEGFRALCEGNGRRLAEAAQRL